MQQSERGMTTPSDNDARPSRPSDDFGGPGSRSGETTYATDLFSLPDLPDGSAQRIYMLVFEGKSSSMFQIPRTGDVLIGRAKDVDLHLNDASVSRKHARMTMVGSEARLEDLGSHNGTFVNGEKLTGTRRLSSGDVINICTASLVFHSSIRLQPTRILLEMDAFRLQLEGEVERAIRYHRPFALITIGTFVGATERWSLVRALERIVRRIDRMAWSASDYAYLLLPESNPDEVGPAARRVLEAALDTNPNAKLGYAACPLNGADADTIMASARGAFSAADDGKAVSADNAFRSIAVGAHNVIIADEAMTRMYALIERLATVDLPVLVYGETGTGKELAAEAVHSFSRRHDKPLLTLNCAALQENLVESELFGHMKGAFTSANVTKPGLLETAAGGTVFLDEIGELSLTSQAKLLRVLETHRFTRLGDVKEREVDVRFVAATNRDLKEEVKEGRFREDLYFRLSAATVWLPPLRDRKREIPILAEIFLTEACAQAKRDAMTLSEEAIQVLVNHQWPGNVRELKNAMDYVAAAVTDEVVDTWEIEAHLYRDQAPPHSDGETTPAPALKPETKREQDFRPIKEEIRELEKVRMIEALEAAEGNQTHAAGLIKMPLRTFVSKVKQYGVVPKLGR